MESNKIEFDIIWTSTAYKTFDINIEFIKKRWDDKIVQRFISQTESKIEK